MEHDWGPRNKFTQLLPLDFQQRCQRYTGKRTHSINSAGKIGHPPAEYWVTAVILSSHTNSNGIIDWLKNLNTEDIRRNFQGVNLGMCFLHYPSSTEYTLPSYKMRLWKNVKTSPQQRTFRRVSRQMPDWDISLASSTAERMLVSRIYNHFKN